MRVLILLGLFSLANLLCATNALTFYCINMPTSTARRERMEQRFRVLRELATRADGRTVRVIWVPGIIPTSGLAQHYAGMLAAPSAQDLANAACAGAHLKAVRTFLESDEQEAFICEDDIMFHNDFWTMYDRVYANLPPRAPLASFSHMSESYQGSEWMGLVPSQYNLRGVTNGTWGGQLYFVRQWYAKHILTQFDHNHNIRAQFNEYFIQHSAQFGGVMVMPPLAVEESYDSDRNDWLSLPFHRNLFNYWGKSNYVAGEKTEL